MTNYSKKGDRSSPLGKLLKQLRFRHEDFRLRQQHQSEIRFPGHSLSFTNEFEFFEAEVARQFPSQIDGFRKLVKIIEEFDELTIWRGTASANESMSSTWTTEGPFPPVRCLRAA